MREYNADLADEPHFLPDFLTDITSYEQDQVTHFIRTSVIKIDTFITVAKKYSRQDNGKTVLHVIAELGDENLLRVLLNDKEINPFIPDSVGETPFDIAKRLHFNNLPLINIFVQSHACINQKFNFQTIALTNAYVTGHAYSDIAAVSEHIYDTESLTLALNKANPPSLESLTLLKYRLMQYIEFIPYLIRRLGTPAHHRKLISIQTHIEKLLESDTLQSIKLTGNFQLIAPADPVYIEVVNEEDELEDDALRADENEALIRILTVNEQKELLDRLYKATKKRARFVNEDDIKILLNEARRQFEQFEHIKNEFIVDLLQDASFIYRRCGTLSPYELKKLMNAILSILFTLAILLFVGIYDGILLGICLGKLPMPANDEILAMFLYSSLPINLLGICSPCCGSRANELITNNFSHTPINEMLKSDEEINLTQKLQEHLSQVFGLSFSDEDYSTQIGSQAILEWCKEQVTKTEEKLQKKNTSLAQCKSTLYYRAPPQSHELLSLSVTSVKSAAYG